MIKHVEIYLTLLTLNGPVSYFCSMFFSTLTLNFRTGKHIAAVHCCILSRANSDFCKFQKYSSCAAHWLSDKNSERGKTLHTGKAEAPQHMLIRTTSISKDIQRSTQNYANVVKLI